MSLDDTLDALRELQSNHLVVKTADGFFEFYHEGVMVYDIKPSSPANALRWVEHIANKTWVTKAHIRQFAAFVAESYGEGHN